MNVTHFPNRQTKSHVNKVCPRPHDGKHAKGAHWEDHEARDGEGSGKRGEHGRKQDVGKVERQDGQSDDDG
jgi:hypothetical protein